MKTLAFHSALYRDSRYLVIAHTEAAPAVEEWNGYLAAVGEAVSVEGPTVYAFVVTDGGGPSSTQRKEIAEVFSGGAAQASTHVFTTSAFVRGIVTAFHWMNWSPTEAHNPSNFPTVCVRCGFPPLVVLSEFERLQEQLPPVAVLRKITLAAREFR